MENASQLGRRFREVLLDGKWIANTNFNELLSDLNWQQATQKVGTLNTIAALTFHVNYYVGGVLQVFKGGDLEIRDKYSFDFSPITSQEEWEALRALLMHNSEEFAREVERLSEDQLEAPFIDEKYGSYRRNIEGMIEHCYYHMGQVSLLKKMVLGG
ncbi:MAG: DinB family protein [Saprospiraceae bacterium]